jgi:hypothetical protein
MCLRPLVYACNTESFDGNPWFWEAREAGTGALDAGDLDRPYGLYILSVGSGPLFAAELRPSWPQPPGASILLLHYSSVSRYQRGQDPGHEISHSCGGGLCPSNGSELGLSHLAATKGDMAWRRAICFQVLDSLVSECKKCLVWCKECKESPDHLILRRTVGDNYPFLHFVTVVLAPFIYWVFTVEVGVSIGSPRDNQLSFSFGQVCAGS